MAGLTRLPPLGKLVTVPPQFSVSRLSAAADCLLRLVMPASPETVFPTSPLAEWGRVVHSLFETVSKRRLDPSIPSRRAMEEMLSRLIDKTDEGLAASPFAFRLFHLKDAFPPLEWKRRCNTAVENALVVQRQEAEVGVARKSSPAKTPFDLRSALGTTGYSGSEVFLPETPLRLAGRIDSIRVLSDGAIEIIDYKSGNAFDDQGRPSERVALQLRLYALAIAKLMPSSRIEIRVVSNDLEELIPFGETEARETGNWLLSRLDQLPAGAALPSAGLGRLGKQCQDCELRPTCPTYRVSIPEHWNRSDSPFLSLWTSPEPYCLQRKPKPA